MDEANQTQTQNAAQEAASSAEMVAAQIKRNKQRRKEKEKAKKRKKLLIKIGVAAAPFLLFILIIVLIVAMPMSIITSMRDNNVVNDLSLTSFSASQPVIKYTGLEDVTPTEEWADKTEENLGAEKHGFSAIKEGFVNFFGGFLDFLTGHDTSEVMADIDETVAQMLIASDLLKTEYGATIVREVTAVYKYFVDAYADKMVKAKSVDGPVYQAGFDYIQENGLADTRSGQSMTRTTTLIDPETGVERVEVDIYNVNINYVGDTTGDFLTPVFYLLSANSAKQSELGDGTTDEAFALSSVMKAADESAPDSYKILAGADMVDVELPDAAPTIYFDADAEPDSTETVEEYADSSSGSGEEGEDEGEESDDGDESGESRLVRVTTTNTYNLFVPYSVTTDDDGLVNVMKAAGAENPADREHGERNWIEANFEQLCKFLDIQAAGGGDFSWARAVLPGGVNIWSASGLGEEDRQALMEALNSLSGERTPVQQRIAEMFMQIAMSANPTQTAQALGCGVRGGYCQAFVADFLARATGQPRHSYGSALGAWQATGVSTDSNPPDGACIYANSRSSPQYGHVGIYCAGYVIDCIGGGVGGKVGVYTFEQWKAQNYVTYLGWGTGGVDWMA